MFADQLSENWESTENQDAFIKEYFGKVEVLSKSGRNLEVEKGQFRKINSIQKFKNQSNEDNHTNFVCSSSKIKRKHSLLNGDLKFKKKLKKFISSFEDDCDEINVIGCGNDTEQSHIVDLNSQVPKQKKSKNKNNHDDVMEFGSEIESVHTGNAISNKSVKNLNDFKAKQSHTLDFKNQKSKKKKKLKNKKHLEDSLINSDNEEQEENFTEVDSKIVKPHDKAGTIPNNLTTVANTVMKEKSDVVESRNRKSKKKRSKKKNIHKEESLHCNEELEENDEVESEPEAKQPLVVGRKSNILSANKNSTFQNKIQQKFQAAKFRYLNEMLYKSPGQEALSYFQENNDEFEDYHIGYQSQVSKWPVNPVDIIIQEIRQMNKEAVIADLGCGEAKITDAFPKRTVHSFDLIALRDCVTACDMANVPLQNNSIDVAVFCLSLMGTNWKDYVRESHRILKLGAILKIAEIESRIENVNFFIKNIESFGFSLESQDLSHKMFIFLNFKKTGKSKKKSKVPDITLKPCLYKKR